MLSDEIARCIAEMRLAEFQYKGSWRLVEPHLLGITHKGKICLSAFQLSGGSAAAWRAFLVDEIQSFVVSDQHFAEARPGYNPNDSTMRTIIASI